MSTKSKKSTKSKQQRGTKYVALSPEDVKKLPRPHKGFDAFVGPLVALFKENSRALSTDGLDVAGLLGVVRQYQALAETEYAATKQLEKVQTTRLVYAANAWHTVLEMYARALVVGRTNAAVKAGIADFVQFMKHARKRKTKASGPVTPAAV
jgi:hypothetical protein